MKSIVLCDTWGVDATADFCEMNGLGIEIQHFFLPSQPSGDALVTRYASRISGLAPRAMHGMFADLCPGSIDPAIKDITLRRFEESYSKSGSFSDHIKSHAEHGKYYRDFWEEEGKKAFEDYLQKRRSTAGE